MSCKSTLFAGLWLVLLHRASAQAPASPPAPASWVPPDAYSGSRDRPWNGTAHDIVVRFVGASVVPFNVTVQQLVLETAREVLSPAVGPLAFIDFKEVLPGDGSSSEPSPFVDLHLKLFAFGEPETARRLLAAGQTAELERVLTEQYSAFVALVVRLAFKGFLTTPRVISLNPVDTVFKLNDVQMLPLVPATVSLKIQIFDEAKFRNGTVDSALGVLRSVLAGQVSVVQWASEETGMAAALRRDKTVNATARVMAYACRGGPGAWVCQDSLFELARAIAANNYARAIAAADVGLAGEILTVQLTPFRSPSSSAIPSLAAGSAQGSPAAPSRWQPSTSGGGPVPWHLDRLDSRERVLDGKFTASNLGSGVSVYLLSSGVEASHIEFGTLGGGPQRVKPVWGYQGIDPLRDCNDSSSWYGYGTYAASLVAGLSVGVAKNATIYSARFREKCTFADLRSWQPGGLPSAMDAVLTSAAVTKPALMLVDTWWSPSRSAYDDDAYISEAIKIRLDAAAKAGILVIAPAGDTDPCSNVFASHPAVLSVAAVDSYDQRTLGSLSVLGNWDSPCIDLYAPGGGLGQALVGASAERNDSYIEVAPRADAAAHIVAGIAAQYLSLNPEAKPADIIAYLKASATQGAVRDIGPRTPNRLAFTNLTQPAATLGNGTGGPGAPSPGLVQPQSKSSGAKSLSGGAIMGIALGAVAGVILASAAFLIRRRRLKPKPAPPPPPPAGSPPRTPDKASKLWGTFTSLDASNLGSPRGGLENSSSPRGLGSGSSARGGPGSSGGGATPATSRHTGDGGSAVEPAMQSWAIDERDIKVLIRDDGRDWVLGRGNFGVVYKALRNEVQVVAVKVVAVDKEGYERDREAFIREIATMKYVSHDLNIVQFHGACLQAGNLMLITEFMEGGDLQKALMEDRDGSLSWAQRGKAIALDVARGLAFLHAAHVTHRDLKSKNVLLTRDGVAKIGDVGMANVMAEGYFHGESAVGTFAWAAPELSMGERCTEKVDIYSFGVLLWEIVTKGTPVRGSLRKPRAPDECPLEVVQLIEACMQRNAADRPSAKEVYRALQAAPPVPYGAYPETTSLDFGEIGDLPRIRPGTPGEESTSTFSSQSLKSSRADSIRLQQMVTEIRQSLKQPGGPRRNRPLTPH